MNKTSNVYKMYCLACVFAYAVGAIGGAGYAGYSRAWFVMVCVLLLAAMAAPYMVARFKDLLA